MAAIPLFAFYFFANVVLLSSADENMYHPDCPPFPCGERGDYYRFPFTNMTNHSCGIYQVNCSEPVPTIQFKQGGYRYKIESITQQDSVVIRDEELNKTHLIRSSCEAMEKFSFPTNTSVLSNVSIQHSSWSSLFNCSHSLDTKPPSELVLFRCRDYDIYRTPLHANTSFPFAQRCSAIQLPIADHPASTNQIDLTPHFTVVVNVLQDCEHCWYIKMGRCGINGEKKFTCSIKADHKLALKLGLGLGLSLGLVICLVIGFFLRQRYIRRRNASNIISRNGSDPHMNSDLETGSVIYGVPVFSYKDLKEATNNFDSDKELGDGGFGTVYFGVLKDGREVAVKRLYEHNYKRMEQFINEIKILTRLRHQNLVSLYGCTSRRCRELLLVYEYIPNGTVADHLHGDRAQTSPLTWPIRMSIAIETASALAYLHASDIVHRDVKTNNILLDSNFSVKVADFGLSRLFPNDVTHVSTAPQGTPGYVDPEYHQCYQLTSKSDVYSFGVVLIELISSMPAVDITRHRHEINLSNLAISKIQKNEYHELVDPSLGFDPDSEVKRMTIAVAKLAFQCLRQDKEMRPTMKEVLEELKIIESGKSEAESQEGFDDVTMCSVHPPPSPECDEVGLLKSVNEEPPSPNAVTEKWHSSRSTTPNISG